MTSIYAALSALIIVWLSLQTIKLRRAKKIRLGDGADSELQAAIRAHGNATEYIPISIILLGLLEMSGGEMVLIHFAGLAILAGRLLHARGLLADSLGYRVLGMQVTIFTILGLAIANVFYVIYNASQDL